MIPGLVASFAVWRVSISFSIVRGPAAAVPAAGVAFLVAGRAFKFMPPSGGGDSIFSKARWASVYKLSNVVAGSLPTKKFFSAPRDLTILIMNSDHNDLDSGIIVLSKPSVPCSLSISWKFLSVIA